MMHNTASQPTAGADEVQTRIKGKVLIDVGWRDKQKALLC